MAGGRSAPRSSITSKPSHSGICTSRKRRSGWVRRITVGASGPEPHSATMSIVGSGLRRTRTFERARGSSSTITVRIFRASADTWCSSVFDKWNGDGDLDAAWLKVVHVEYEGVSVEALQACAHVGETDAGASKGGRWKARAVVVDRECECAVFALGRDAHETALCTFGDAMLDGIFNHQLQNERWNLRDEKVAGNIDGELEAIDEPDLLNIQILLSKHHLFGERHLLTRWVGEKSAQKVA